ncbi:MAG: alpha-hydroxy-acid oxidizing protein [Pseudomonadales bacterium]|nr:alpha-hydroxy-acid oxidizing protein [Pseudomonadales bacterium]
MAEPAFRTIHQIVRAAKLRLDRTYWDYLVGGTETETTLRRNRLAIDSTALVPSVLNDVSNVDPSGSLLGAPLTIPCLLAPIGSLQVFEAGGGATAARAAAEYGVMSIASSVCTPDVEEIAAASDAPKIYQLYVRGDEKWVDDIIERVVASGYKGFCLTVDTAVVSRRERDIAKAVIPTSQATPGDFSYQAKLNWSDVERIKSKFDIPVILKGINTPADTARALDLGVEVIYVSNHGGRQLDQGRGALDVLPEIVQAVDGRAEIVVDGGFYRGTDIVKAMALGANAVGLGRLEAWAMAAGGQPVLVQCLRILESEIRSAMALCGVRSFAEIDSRFVTHASPVYEPSVTSAFPLLDLDGDVY